MTLVSKIKDGFARNLDFIIASSTYVAASTADYFFTEYALLTNQFFEGNPIISLHMNLFGDNGLLISKLFFGSVAIAGSKILDYEYKRGRTKIKPSYILYSGALITGLAGLSWLVQKEIFN